MIAEGKIPNKGGVFIDAYNQSINEDIAGTITTRVDASNHIFVTDISKGFAEAYEGDSIILALPNSKTRRGRVVKQMANTLNTGCQQGVVEHYRIRKLTSGECLRLMGVDDADIDTIQSAGISNSQQYKMAGNSIVVDVLYHIFRKMFIDKGNDDLQKTIFDV